MQKCLRLESLGVGHEHVMVSKHLLLHIRRATALCPLAGAYVGQSQLAAYPFPQSVMMHIAPKLELSSRACPL